MNKSVIIKNTEIQVPEVRNTGGNLITLINI